MIDSSSDQLWQPPSPPPATLFDQPPLSAGCPLPWCWAVIGNYCVYSFHSVLHAPPSSSIIQLLCCWAVLTWERGTVALKVLVVTMTRYILWDAVSLLVLFVCKFTRSLPRLLAGMDATPVHIYGLKARGTILGHSPARP